MPLHVDLVACKNSVLYCWNMELHNSLQAVAHCLNTCPISWNVASIFIVRNGGLHNFNTLNFPNTAFSHTFQPLFAFASP